MAAELQRRIPWLGTCAFSVVLAVCCPARGIEVLFVGPNASVTLGLPYAELEYNNPLQGNEMVDGCSLLNWRDAGFECPNPYGFEDWTVNAPCFPVCNASGCINGYENEIWLRQAGHSATTTTTVASCLVSVHLNGDSNDGIADIVVDGVTVATLDMFTSGVDNALVKVAGLAKTTHTIVVNDVGPSQQQGADPSADDIAILGAGVLVCCPWDLDGDGNVGVTDLLLVLGRWGSCPVCCQDFDGSGSVDVVDLLKLLGHWGPCT